MKWGAFILLTLLCAMAVESLDDMSLATRIGLEIEKMAAEACFETPPPRHELYRSSCFRAVRMRLVVEFLHSLPEKIEEIAQVLEKANDALARADAFQRCVNETLV